MPFATTICIAVYETIYAVNQMTTPHSALAELTRSGNTDLAAKMARQYKIDRPYLGVSNPQIDTLYKAWRSNTDMTTRIAIAAYLWDSNIHEARIAAAKLLTQARINPDTAVWDEILRWVPDFDGAALTDHACGAIARRLPVDPSRLDTLENWVTDTNALVRRAALIATLPWAKMNNPSEPDLVTRERVLGWIATYTVDKDPSLQRAVAEWLRSLSKHAKPRAIEFIEEYGHQMQAHTVKEISAVL